MQRWREIVVLLTSVALLGGCAMATGSRLDEYQVKAEELAADIVGKIPADLAPSTPPDVESRGRTLQNPVSAEPSPEDSVWWQVDTYVEPVQRDGASEDAAKAIAADLLADGWEHTDVRETSEGRRTADAYDKGGWYVEVTWVRSEEGKYETIEIGVFSPTTTRGDHDDIHS